MTYDSAKTNFQDYLERQKRDLKKYAEGEDPSQRAIDARLSGINSLIDFFNAAEETINSKEWELLQLQIQYQKLHEDTEKLVLFCQLHSVNPNMVFYYTTEEIKKILACGIRVMPPTRDLNRFIVQPDENGYALFYQEEEHNPDQYREFINKYYSVKQFGARL